jgi:glutamate-1-semialdehyde 2,1-aminomutase
MSFDNLLATDEWPVPHAKSKAMFEKAKQLMPGGVDGQSRLDSPHPIFMARADGAYIEDVDGNRYVDFHCGFGSVLLGHNDPRIRETIDETLTQSGVHFATAHPLEMELASRLQSALPSAERVVFACTGTEVTYHAVRLARVHTNRRRVVKFEGNYHGWHDYLYWSVRFDPSNAGPVDHPIPVAQSAGMGAEAESEILTCEYNDIEQLRVIFANHASEIAAIIVEPIFHNGGAVMPAPGFLETCRELCSQYGSVLIFDEVITGFRQSMGGAQSLFGVTPDLTTLGKAMANGFPISVLAGRREVMEDLSPLGPSYFSGTFNGHVLNVAIANRCCKILESEPPYESLSALGSTLRQGIENAIGDTGVPARIAQFGSVWSLHFSREPIGNYRDLARMGDPKGRAAEVAYRRFMMTRGYYIHPHSVIRGYLTTSHTRDQIDGAIAATRAFFEGYRENLLN